MFSKPRNKWEDINIFTATLLNASLIVPLQKYIDKHGSQAPSSFTIFNRAASLVGIKTMQPYAAAALKIAEATTGAIGKKNNFYDKKKVCQYILAGLEELLSIYDKESKEISGHIQTTFQNFLGIDPATTSLEEFEKLKQQIFKYHEITQIEEKVELGGKKTELYHVVDKPYFSYT